MSEGSIDYSCANGVATITFNNPDRRNAVSLRMWQQLEEVIGQITEDIRCVVLTGAGGKAFAAGADITEFRQQRREPASRASYDTAAYGAMDRLYALPQPTIAQISGFCIGAGMALALCCDVRFASEGSIFAIPAGRLGLGYGISETKRLVDAVGVSVATDMLISARRYMAAEALAMRLVTRVVEAGQLQEVVDAYAAAVSSNAPITVQGAKRIIKELARTSPDADLGLCAALVDRCFASADYIEGIEAFLGKRAPIFTGS